MKNDYITVGLSSMFKISGVVSISTCFCRAIHSCSDVMYNSIGYAKPDHTKIVYDDGKEICIDCHSHDAVDALNKELIRPYINQEPYFE